MPRKKTKKNEPSSTRMHLLCATYELLQASHGALNYLHQKSHDYCPAQEKSPVDDFFKKTVSTTSMLIDSLAKEPEVTRMAANAFETLINMMNSEMTHPPHTDHGEHND